MSHPLLSLPSHVRCNFSLLSDATRSLPPSRPVVLLLSFRFAALAEQRRATCYAREATTDRQPDERKKKRRNKKKGIGRGRRRSTLRQRQIRREWEIYCGGSYTRRASFRPLYHERRRLLNAIDRGSSFGL